MRICQKLSVLVIAADGVIYLNDNNNPKFKQSFKQSSL